MTLSSIRVRIYNKTGAQLAEVQPEIRSVAWRFNAVGRADFTLPKSDPKCIPANLALGNRVYIEFENGLPDWGGVIDVPRKRSSDSVDITAHSGEHILGWRVTGKNVTYTEQVPGYIYRALIQQANVTYPTTIDIGDIETGTATRSEEYHHHGLLKRVKELSRKSGQDFSVTPRLESGVLRFRAHWYLSRGSDKTGAVWLIDGENVTDVRLEEQGRVANRVLQIGAGQTWGDGRLVEEAQDLDSRAAYDYRESAETANQTDTTTLQASAESILDEMKDPRYKFNAVAVNLKPALFASYDLGDTVTLHAHQQYPDWAYEGTVRVMGREWRPNDTCRLQLEEV
jgi:hypothetical protein